MLICCVAICLIMRGMNIYGIWFWAGAGLYCLINIILNSMQVAQIKVLSYNYIILGAAAIGLILNIFLLRQDKGR